MKKKYFIVSVEDISSTYVKVYADNIGKAIETAEKSFLKGDIKIDPIEGFYDECDYHISNKDFFGDDKMLQVVE